MKRIIILLPVLAILLWSFAPTPEHLSVAIAANMQFVMEQLKPAFEKESGIPLDITVGSSGTLSAQIMESAPFDVFVSADMKYPQELYDKGFATAAPQIYAKGILVLWTARTGIQPTADLSILLKKEVQKVAIANPKTAPYGLAALEALRYFRIYDGVKAKLVYGENIGQTEQFVATQAADIGFIAKSLVLSDEMKGKGTYVEVDNQAYRPIEQGVVVLKHGKDTKDKAAQKFYKFLFSAKAKAIFRKYGYIVNDK